MCCAHASPGKTMLTSATVASDTFPFPSHRYRVWMAKQYCAMNESGSAPGILMFPSKQTLSAAVSYLVFRTLFFIPLLVCEIVALPLSWYLVATFSFAIFAIVDQRLNIPRALYESFRLTLGFKFETMVLHLIFQLLE